MSDRLLRALRWLLPSAWRAAIARDLEDEARAQGRGAIWVAWQTLRVGTRLRVTFGAGALWFDLRYAIRSLIRAPWFTAGAVLTFALGIGVNIAVFAVIDRVMFRPLPYAEPDRLVQIHSARITGTALSGDVATARVAIQHSQAAAIKARAGVFAPDDIVAPATWVLYTRAIAGLGETPLRLMTMSPDELRILGIRPVAGRAFNERRRAGEMELLVTSEFWRARLGRSPEAFARLYGDADGRYRIVGVLPADFLPPNGTARERIDALQASQPNDLERESGGIIPPLIARLRPGTSLAHARAEVRAIAGPGVHVEPLQTGLFFPLRSYLWLVVVAVALVWLVAAVNLTVLLLARGRSRAGEIAVRVAIGAPRGRVISSALLETGLVCMAGAAVGLAVCYATGSFLLSIVPGPLRPFAVDVFDGRLLLMTTAAALSSAVVAGVWPAWRRAKVDPLDALRDRAVSSATPSLRGSATLVMLQAALGLTLTAGATLAVRNFAGLVWRDPGFAPANLYYLQLSHGNPGGSMTAPPSLSRIETVRRVASSWPEAVDVAVASQLPVGPSGAGTRDFWDAVGAQGQTFGIGSGVFRALGTPVIAGREFTTDDVAQQSRVAVVSAGAVSRLWPGAELTAVPGRDLVMGRGQWTVVGVVADIRPTPVRAPSPALYLPMTLADAKPSSSNLLAVVRLAPGARPADEVWTRTLDDAFGKRGSLGIVPVSETVVPWLQQPRFQAVLFGALSAVALLLTAVGVFAVASFDVAQRRRECGIRLTLGATPRDLVRDVCRRALRPVSAGVAAGLIGAWWGGELLQAFLVEVDGRDPWTLGFVAVTLVSIALVAAWLPAVRAGRVSPADTLRSS